MFGWATSYRWSSWWVFSKPRASRRRLDAGRDPARGRGGRAEPRRPSRLHRPLARAGSAQGLPRARIRLRRRSTSRRPRWASMRCSSRPSSAAPTSGGCTSRRRLKPTRRPGKPSSKSRRLAGRARDPGEVSLLIHYDPAARRVPLPVDRLERRRSRRGDIAPAAEDALAGGGGAREAIERASPGAVLPGMRRRPWRGSRIRASRSGTGSSPRR